MAECSSQNLDTVYTCIYKTVVNEGYPVRQARIISKSDLDPAIAPDTRPIVGLTDFMERFQIVVPYDIIDNPVNEGLSLVQIHAKFPEFSLEDLAYTKYDDLLAYLADYQAIVDREITVLDDLFLDPDLLDRLDQKDIPAGVLENIIEALQNGDVSDMSSVHRLFQVWLRRARQDLRNDELVLQNILAIQSTLLSPEVTRYTEKYQYSGINPSRRIFSYNIEIPEAEYARAGILSDDPDSVLAKAEFGINIFNQTLTSASVPLIQYNDSKLSGTDNQLYRVYRGEVTGTIDYSKVLKGSTDAKRSLYYRVFIGSRRRKKSAGSYETLEYQVPEGKLLLTENIVDRQLPGQPGSKEHLLDKFRASNGIRLQIGDEPVLDSIKGWFNIYNAGLNDVIFLDMLNTSPEFFNYIFMDETQEIYPNKTNLTIRTTEISEVMKFGGIREVLDNFKGELPKPIRATIKIDTVEAGLSYPVTSRSGTESVETLTPGNYLIIKFDRVTSDKMVQDFRHLMIRLLGYYESQLTRLLGLYNQYFGDIGSRGIAGEKPKIGLTKPLKILKDYDTKISKERGVPSLIVKMYARECEAHKPTAVDRSEIRKEIDINGRTVFKWTGNPDLQVLPFPNMIDPYWFFVCRYKDHQFPGLKVNNLSNRYAYPFIPCCYKHDKMVSSDKNWEDYVKGSRPTPKFAKLTEQEILTRATISPGRFSVIDPDLLMILKSFKPDNYYRYGAPVGANSFLHSVLTAVDSKYRNLRTLNELEDYAVGIRFIIAATINTMVMAQETFDMSDESRYRNLANPEVYLDPDLYYRALEEYFGVNIYVFTAQTMNIPRYRLFQVRYHRPERPTILIYKHYGGKSADAVDYPQSDLIVSAPEGKNRISIHHQSVIKKFEVEVTEGVNEMYNNVLQNLTWEIESADDAADNVLQARQNMYSKFNYERIIQSVGGTVQAQTIDDLGKTRIVQFIVGETSVIMYTQPGQPIGIDAMPAEDLTEGLPTVEQILSIAGFFSSPSSAAFKESKVVGLWYNFIDLKNAFFIPVQNTASIVSLAPGPPSVVRSSSGSRYLRLQHLKRTSHIYMQLLLLAFSKYMGDIKEFVNEYLVIPSTPVPDIDTAKVYNMDTLINLGVRWIPNFANIHDATDYIFDKTQGVLNEDGQFIAYSQKFYDGLVYFLEDYLRTKPEESKVQPKLLHGILTQESDFKVRPDEIVFANKDRVDAWIKVVTGPDYTSVDIHKEVRIGVTDIKQTPYIYNSPDGKMYLIQNTHLKSLRAAIQVSYTWWARKLNLGYSRISEYQEPELPAYKVYEINDNHQLRVQFDYSNGLSEYLRVINYSGPGVADDKRVYGAVLELL